MSEEGTVASADNAGGLINAKAGASPVSYDALAVSGVMPRAHQTVCFDRPSAQSTGASSVRVGSCAAAQLALHLERAFAEQLDLGGLTEDSRKEVERIATERAARILKPVRGGTAASGEAIRAARLSLASAAMSLMAIEAAHAAEGEVTPKRLRDALRRQRPRLPR
jgi:hypothetical protein